MNYYQLGEQTMPIFKNMFSSVEKFTISAIGGLISLYSPVYVPILALAAIIILDTIYECKVNKKKESTDIVSKSKRLYLYNDRFNNVLLTQKMLLTETNSGSQSFQHIQSTNDT